MTTPTSNSTSSRLRILMAALALVILMLAGLLALRALRAPSEGAASAQDGFDMERHLDQIGRIDPEKGFDEAAHQAALHAVGPEHLQALDTYNRLAGELAAREMQLVEAHPEFAEVAGLQDVITNAPPKVEASAEELGKRWQELREQDSAWSALQAKVETAEAARDAARLRLQTLIRARMQAQHDLARLGKAAAPSAPQSPENDLKDENDAKDQSSNAAPLEGAAPSAPKSQSQAAAAQAEPPSAADATARIPPLKPQSPDGAGKTAF